MFFTRRNINFLYWMNTVLSNLLAIVWIRQYLFPFINSVHQYMLLKLKEVFRNILMEYHTKILWLPHLFKFLWLCASNIIIHTKNICVFIEHALEWFLKEIFVLLKSKNNLAFYTVEKTCLSTYDTLEHFFSKH